MKKMLLIMLVSSIFACTSYQNVSSEFETQAKNQALPIVITDLFTGTPNSAGGVNLRINFKNISDKDIKYITFYVVPYNKVNDIVQCTVRDYSTFGGQITGPIKADTYYGRTKSTLSSWGSDMGAFWGNAWYNYTIKYAKITAINIIYMDGTRKAYNSSQIQKMIYSSD